MVKLTVLFGHPENSEAFEEYYAEQHLPLAATMSHVQRFETGRLRTVDNGPSPYYRIAELWFENTERMGEAMTSPVGQAMAADLRNFATGGATFLVSEVGT